MSKVILPAQTLRPERGVTVSLPKVTVKSFADDLMDAANVPTLYHDRLRPLLEARLDPADKPRYDQLLVRVGQPCIRDLVRATFEDLPAKLALVDEQEVNTPEEAEQVKQMKEDIVNSTLSSLPLLLVEPFEESALNDNIVFDADKNPIGVRPTDITRMYTCDLFLKNRMPTKHEELRTKDKEAIAAKYAASPTILKDSIEKYLQVVKSLKELLANMPRIKPNDSKQYRLLAGDVGRLRSDLLEGDAMVAALTQVPPSEKLTLVKDGLETLLEKARSAANEGDKVLLTLPSGLVRTASREPGFQDIEAIERKKEELQAPQAPQALPEGGKPRRRRTRRKTNTKKRIHIRTRKHSK
jgi:hypothetical protein